MFAVGSFAKPFDKFRAELGSEFGCTGFSFIYAFSSRFDIASCRSIHVAWQVKFVPSKDSQQVS